MVDLSSVVLETILRAGIPLEQNLVNAYGPERGYPGVYGLSVLFHPGYSVDQLAQAGYFRHGQISYATVQDITASLAAVRYESVLIHTPTIALPDHHTLGVAQTSIPQQNLAADAAQALSRVFGQHIIANPYRQP